MGHGTSTCWAVCGVPIDERVAEAFLTAAQPPELELALAVSHEAARQADTVDEQWRLRIERARFEARHAERRYKAVDPDNRVVARTLEAQWEEKLRELDEAERGHERARAAKRVALSDEDRRRVLELARDLPRVWRSASTTPHQRKNLLRILVSEVTLTPIDVPTRATRVQVLWESGAVTEYQLPRARYAGAGRATRTAEALVARLVEEGLYDEAIVARLNAEASVGRKAPWDAESVARLRRRLGVSRPFATPAHEPTPDRRGDGLWSARGVARRFGVKTRTVSGWVKLGVLVPAVGGGRPRPAWFDLDEQAIASVEAYIARSARFDPRGAS